MILKNKTALRVVAGLLLCLGACKLLNETIEGWDILDMCDNEVLAKQQAPGGWRKAVVFVRNCGATTGFSTQIAVLPFYRAFTGGVMGNAFACEGNLAQDDIKIRWIDSLHLEVQRPATLRVWQQQAQVGNVSINYVTYP